MKKDEYRSWLRSKGFEESTISSRISDAFRVEKYHGDIDEHYEKKGIDDLLKLVTYSKIDKSNNAENPSKIPISGDLYNGLASCKSAINKYVEFLDYCEEMVNIPSILVLNKEEQSVQKISLERDMQAALRLEIEQLESGINIIDDGVERSVDSGFIDIMARDVNNVAVVIELKVGRAGRDAIGQILSYMGDIASEEESGKVRGILIASDFDGKARAAAKMAPNLILRKYSIRFTFLDG